MRFDLYSVRLFVAVCEEGTIARAAERESIAPSALSRRVSELERQVGRRLFYRRKKGLALTASGETMLHHARILARDVAQMERSLADTTHGHSGSVRIGANAWATAQYLPAQLASFLRAYPNIEVRLDQKISPGAIRSLAENAADFAIIGDEFVAPNITKFLFREDDWRVIVPLDHPLAAREAVRLEDMLDYEFVGATQGSAIDQLVRREAERHGRPLRLRLRVSGSEVIGAMVEAGLGIGVVPGGWLDRHTNSLAVKPIVLAESWSTRRLVICVRDMNLMTPSARLLFDHLMRDAPL